MLPADWVCERSQQRINGREHDQRFHHHFSAARPPIYLSPDLFSPWKFDDAFKIATRLSFAQNNFFLLLEENLIQYVYHQSFGCKRISQRLRAIIFLIIFFIIFLNCLGIGIFLEMSSGKGIRCFRFFCSCDHISKEFSLKSQLKMGFCFERIPIPFKRT